MFFFFQAEDGIRDLTVTGVQTCALPILIAEDLVEPDLERGDAGALALARLEPGDVLLPAVASVLELVELVIVPGSDRVAVGRLGRRALHQRPGELVAQVLEEIEAVRGFLEQR